MLTLALATIVVLTVASLALMLWPDAPSPTPPDDEPDAGDRVVSEEDDTRNTLAG